MSAKNELFKCWMDTIRQSVEHFFLLYMHFILRQLTLVDHNVSRQGSLQQVQTDIYKTVDKANVLQFSAFSLCFLGFLSIINCDSFQVCKTRFVESLKFSAKNDLFKCWIDTIRLSVAHFFAFYAFCLFPNNFCCSQVLKTRFFATSLDRHL